MLQKISIFLFLSTFFLSSSAGQNFWEQINGPRIPADIETLDIQTDWQSRIYVKDLNYYLMSADGGLNWQFMEIPGSQFSKILRLAISPAGSMLAERGDGEVFRSFDNGMTWEMTSSKLPAVQGLKLEYHKPSDAFYFISLSNVYKSINNGDSWVEIAVGDLSTAKYAIMPNGGIYFQTDNFNKFVYFNPVDGTGSPSFNWVFNGNILTNVDAMHATAIGDLFFTAYIFGDQFFFRRNPDGTLDQIPSIGLNRFRPLISDSEGNLFYIFPDNVFYVSYDRGNTWNQLATVPSEFANKYPVYGIENDGHFYIGGYNLPIFRTTKPIGTVKTKNLENEQKIIAYPNPFLEKLTIEMQSPPPVDKLQLRLSDVLGRVLLTQNFMTPTTSIYLKNEQPGIYFYQILADGCVIFSDRILKN